MEDLSWRSRVVSQTRERGSVQPHMPVYSSLNLQTPSITLLPKRRKSLVSERSGVLLLDSLSKGSWGENIWFY